MSEKTFFASPERSSAEQLYNEHQALLNEKMVSTVMNAMPDIAMILNENRQIVGANQRLMDAFGLSSVEPLLGKRPGEAFNCIHYGDGPGGCGTAANCSVCGAVIAILASQTTGKQSTDECRITLQKDGGTALDLEATATPLTVEGMNFTIFTVKDISAEKRKQVMERTFFHDIINTAGGIKGLAELLFDSESLTEEDEIEYKGWMLKLSDNLIEEIKHNRRLFEAERGEYQPHLQPVDLSELLNDVTTLYENHERVPNRTIHLAEIPNAVITTDVPVLRRIIGNMLLNALEAVSQGSVVTLSGRHYAGNIRIEVSNPGVIPPDVQLKIFKRSFSTKGASGRGIGTYSMKLFGERYLGGTVGFECDNGQTTFFLELPLQQPQH